MDSEDGELFIKVREPRPRALAFQSRHLWERS
jgi:hypothetical protein